MRAALPLITAFLAQLSHVYADSSRPELSPARRDPLQGFQRYTGGLDLTSESYWAASIWLGQPFMLVALGWVLIFLVMLIVRCVCCVKGEAFCVEAFFPDTAITWNIVLRTAAFVVLISKLAALTVFGVYGVIGQRAGRRLMASLSSSLPDVEKTAIQLHLNATFLQYIMDGSTLVAGVSLQQEFSQMALSQPLTTRTQAIVDGVRAAMTQMADAQRYFSAGQDAISAAMVIAFAVTACVVVVGLFSLSLNSRALYRLGVFVVPPASALLWIMLAMFYTYESVVSDICEAAALSPLAMGSYDVWNVVPAQPMFVPCIATENSAALVLDTNATYAKLLNISNEAIVRQYSKPIMTPFENEPLVCEDIVLDEPAGKYEPAVCPFPTSLHRFSADNWEGHNTALHCTSNSDLECAAAETPLTASVFEIVTQTLDYALKSRDTGVTAQHFQSCYESAAIEAAVYRDSCESPDARYQLWAAWTSGLAVALIAALWCPMSWFLLAFTAPPLPTAVSAVYGPSYSLPVKTMAAGFRRSDYVPGATGHTVSHSMPFSDHASTGALEPFLTVGQSQEVALSTSRPPSPGLPTPPSPLYGGFASEYIPQTYGTAGGATLQSQLYPPPPRAG